MKGFDGRLDEDVGRLRGTRDFCWWGHECQVGSRRDKAERCVTPHLEILPKGKDLGCLVKPWDSLEHF